MDRVVWAVGKRCSGIGAVAIGMRRVCIGSYVLGRVECVAGRSVGRGRDTLLYFPCVGMGRHHFVADYFYYNHFIHIVSRGMADVDLCESNAMDCGCLFGRHGIFLGQKRKKLLTRAGGTGIIIGTNEAERCPLSPPDLVPKG